jgi:hypothetical protein
MRCAKESTLRRIRRHADGVLGRHGKAGMSNHGGVQLTVYSVRCALASGSSLAGIDKRRSHRQEDSSKATVNVGRETARKCRRSRRLSMREIRLSRQAALGQVAAGAGRKPSLLSDDSVRWCEGRLSAP